jgi:hypothetical protein
VGFEDFGSPLDALLSVLECCPGLDVFVVLVGFFGPLIKNIFTKIA